MLNSKAPKVDNMPVEIENIGRPQEEILIVDDDKLIVKALEKTLQQEGCRIHQAYNGEDAIEMLQKFPIAVIICDQNMPTMSGIEVLKKAQKICPDAVRIILTGQSNLDVIIQAVNEGQVSQFIVKPWDDIQLRRIVASGIEKFRLKKENKNLQQLLLNQHREVAETYGLLRQELQLGARIHQTLLIGKTPQDVEGLSIAALTIPSKYIVGDFFEFYRIAPQILDVVIGDVMGKGIASALVGTAVKTQLMRFAIPFIRSQVYDKQDLWKEDLLTPQEILKYVHNEIAQQLIQLEYFVSLFYGRFDLEKRVLSYVDCGSAKPIHYNAAQKKSHQLQGNSYPIGMVESDQYALFQRPFSEDDLFILYSDGLTEAKSPEGELFGTERLIAIIEAYAEEDINTLLAKIKNSVLSFTKQDYFDDDLTLIVIKVALKKARKKRQRLKAKFSSEPSQLKAVRKFVQRCCKNIPGDPDKLAFKLQLAINEAFSNIIKHSYENRPGHNIIIESRVLEDGILFQLSDSGKVFNPLEVPEPNFSGEQGDGFGWYIIKEIADRISYVQKESGAGLNHLCIFKRYIYKEDAMNIEHSLMNDILIIVPGWDSLDAKDAPAFKEMVIDLISSYDVNQVVLDLYGLNFIDSSGLGCFLSILRVLNSRGGRLKLAGMNKTIRTMFELVSMHKIFEIFNTKEQAIQSFQSKIST